MDSLLMLIYPLSLQIQQLRHFTNHREGEARKVTQCHHKVDGAESANGVRQQNQNDDAMNGCWSWNEMLCCLKLLI
jgi:hypothetical protein